MHTYSKTILVRVDDKCWFGPEFHRNSRKRVRLKRKSVKTGNLTDSAKYKR